MNAYSLGSNRVAVVGFGQVGCSIGAFIADRGLHVVGIDSNPTLVEAINAGKSPFYEPGLDDLVAANVKAGRLQAVQEYEAIRASDVVLVTVGTPLSNDGIADLSQITTAAQQIAPHIRDGQLVILKSTVPPNATSDVVYPILRNAAEVLLAYCPERLAEGNALQELSTIPVIVGGIDSQSTRAAAAFWGDVLGLEVIEVSDARTAELVKLADNLWIDLNIALGNELAKLCDKLDLDVLEVIDAANSLPKVNHNVNILVPSLGVGGSCLTKDPWFVHRMGKTLGLDLQTPRVSRHINDGMPDYSVSLIEELLLGKDIGPENCKCPAEKELSGISHLCFLRCG